MTTVRITPTSIVAEGHTDRELCIAISAMLQTAEAVMDGVMFYPEEVESDETRPPDGYFAVRKCERPEWLWGGVRNAVRRLLTDLAEDHPGRLTVYVATTDDTPVMD